MHWLSDVLELHGAKIAHLQIEARLDLPICLLGKTNGPGPRDSFEPGRDVNSVAHEVAVALLDDVAHVNPDAELDPPILRHSGVALDEAVLNLDRAADGVHDTAKLDNASIAGAFHDTAVMSGDGRVDEVAAQRPEPRERAILVGARQPAVSDGISNQNRRELSGLAHCAPPAVGRLAQMPAQVCPNAGSFYAETD